MKQQIIDAIQSHLKQAFNNEGLTWTELTNPQMEAVIEALLEKITSHCNNLTTSHPTNNRRTHNETTSH